MAWPVAWSRLPVGSSASTMAGLPTRARAMATRWRWPPESWLGRAWGRAVQTDQAEGVEGPCTPFDLGDAGIEETIGHVVQNALVLGQEELLEHEADPRGPQRGQLPIRELVDVEAGDPHVAPNWVGPSVPIRCNKVVLPDPEGPTMPTSSPSVDGERDVPQGGHRRLARVNLVTWSTSRTGPPPPIDE